MQIQVGIITISDRASAGDYEDLGGPALKGAAQAAGWHVLAEAIVPDDAARIQEAVFERSDRMPSDEEVRSWLDLLIVGAPPAEAPTFPGSTTRRFEVFERAS